MENGVGGWWMKEGRGQGTVDKVDQAGTGTGDAGAEGIAWDKHPLTSVQMTLLELNV